MKLNTNKFLLFSFFAFSFSFCYSQNVDTNAIQNQQWQTNGNLADTISFIGTTNQRDLKFKTNNTECFRITKEGNIGIGSYNPLDKLHLNGSLRLSNGDLKLFNLVDSSLSNDEVLIIDTLGIVKRGGDIKSLVYTESLTLTECNDKFGNPKQFSNPVWSNGLNKIYVRCPQIYVGIGTESPRVNLDVRGTSYTNKLAIGNINPTTIGAYIHLKTPISNSSNNYQPLLIENQNQKLLQLNNDGLLYVREVKVNLDMTWPDYVFHKSYDLMPIDELKSFVLENGHLPNVPSACEMEENGINLAETNVMLMQKVEELTLYLFQLQDQIKKQEEIILQLQIGQN
jgi:hypothetical protein